jgi:hypothetical protein
MKRTLSMPTVMAISGRTLLYTLEKPQVKLRRRKKIPYSAG